MFYILGLLPSKLFTNDDDDDDDVAAGKAERFWAGRGEKGWKLLKYETRKESGIFAMAKLANISLLRGEAAVSVCVCVCVV